MNEKWFILDIAQIEKKLKTNAASGLTRKAARSRGNRNNGALFYIPTKSTWKLLLELFTDFSLIILLLGAVFSLFFEVEEYLRGITILALVITNIVIFAVMHFRSQRTMESLMSFFYPTARVIRNGRLFHVDFRSVVVGDVILLERGDVIGCDARLVSSENLKVRMRVDADNYVALDKSATAIVDANVKFAKDMPNMVHGGSVIESGSARAIVTAVGKYTYLGAMTGGIALPTLNESPRLIEKMRRHFSKFNMISLISVLPFCVISLLLSHFLSERESFLSTAFLTSLAIAATVFSQLTCMMFKLFYSSKIRRLSLSGDPSVFKSIDSFDRMASADYLFLLDGCVMTDGILHHDVSVCAEGDIRNYNSLNKTANAFAEYVYLYYVAANQTLALDTSKAEDYFDGIKEFVDKAKVDVEALRIRCSIRGYSAGNLFNEPTRVFFSDRGVAMRLNVSRAISSIGECNTVMLNGERQRLSADGIKNFERVFKKYESAGQIPIIFMITADNGAYADTCFLGILVLKEGIDENFNKHISVLRRYGCNVISFLGNDTAAPKIPDRLFSSVVHKDSIVRSNLPITYSFGNIRAYAGMNDADILSLISYAHSQRKSVVIVGFSEKAAKLSEKADGFISCAAINTRVSGYLDEEIHTTELVGQQGSSTCAQTVKEHADGLISRPKNGKGGLSTLVSLVASVRSINNNISGYLRYMISSSIIMLIMIALPMLLGDALLDARHVVFCAYVLNTFAFFAFMLRSGNVFDETRKNYCAARGLKDYLTGDITVIISSALSSISALVLPMILDLIIGKYNYKIEVLFTSLLLLHIASFIMVYYGNDLRQLKYVYKNKMLIIEIAFSLVIWVICFAFQSFGVLLGIEGWMSLPYFLVSIIPTFIFIIAFAILNKKNKVNKFE